MVKRLIGSDTTGTDGSVSIPYNGTGAGLVNLSVETEIDGSIVSGTLNVWDYILYDEATTGKKNTNWTYTGNPSLETTDNGTTITTDGTTTALASMNTLLTGDFELYVKTVSIAGAIRMNLFNSNSKVCRIIVADTYANYLWRFKRINGVIEISRSNDDGETWTPQTARETDTLATEDCKFEFYITVPSGSSSRGVTFKDLKAYHI